jgi:hypothetical protein
MEDDEEEYTPSKSRSKAIHEVLPAVITYELEAFEPVTEQDDDKTTTRSDLALLNNHLAYCNFALPAIRTVAGLCMLSNTVTKLIETRRKVKKLEYGKTPGKAGSDYEVIS